MPETAAPWQDYDVSHLRLRQVAELVRRLPHRNLLDVGCANGHLRLLCPDSRYTGCDTEAPGSPGSFPLIRCDLNGGRMPPDATGFDVIVCSGLLEYVEDIRALLLDLRSRLFPGGHLVATYFNMRHISRRWLLLRGGNPPVHPSWRSSLTPGEMVSCLKESSFLLLESFVTAHAFRPSPSALDTLDTPLKLPRARAWSPLFGHQFLYVAAVR